MFEIHRQTIAWGGRTLSLETGRIARQADGAVLARYGDTVVLATVTAAKSVREGQDFFPLTVHYREKFSAAGRIPGGFFKRERAPTEAETLASRLIDRPIRPLFPEGFFNEVLVVAEVVSYDGENDPEVLAMVAASAALTLSGLPFLGPIGAARVGFIDGRYVLNPTRDELAQSRLDLVVAGTAGAVMMVESEARELSEEEMLGAVMFAHRGFQPVIEAIVALAESAAREPWELPTDARAGEILARLREAVGPDLTAAYRIVRKSDRQAAVGAAREKARALFADAEPDVQLKAAKLVKTLEAEIVRGAIVSEGARIDGRDTRAIRPIACEVGVLPRAHGSALFTRGETQALVTTTLGTADSEQMIDGLDGLKYEHFMLHYNFPPYSVGEAGRYGSVGRREVGHGKLAWRAIHPVMPSKEEFPYTVRVVSDITESNGSSSMATVCGASLALMDAGVPLKRPVAGIAMGLILEGERYAILSDILGDEDHLGDMDFKVAGTSEGITALQMDIKVPGITEAIMRAALAQAREGRAHILGEMAKAITSARSELAATAPRIETMTVPKEKIREIIGTGGKVIREIVATTGAKVDIEDDGTVRIASSDPARIQAARAWIESIVAEPEIGRIYTGKVVGLVDFGAFVNFLGARDGLVHISEIRAERVAKVGDVLVEGQTVKVKVIGIDERGKVKLSMRVVDQETGEELPDTRAPRSGAGAAGRERRGDGGRDRQGGAGAPGGGATGAGTSGGGRRRREGGRRAAAEDERAAPLPAFLTGED